MIYGTEVNERQLSRMTMLQQPDNFDMYNSTTSLRSAHKTALPPLRKSTSTASFLDFDKNKGINDR